MVQYEKAPITEAIIDIQVEARSGMDLSFLEEVANSVRSDYPKRKDSRVFEGIVEFGPSLPVKTTASEQHDGFVLTDESEKLVLQVKLSGFTLSRLHPYTNWEEFRDEANRLWEIYKNQTLPKSIARIAVRYLNKLDIPLPVRDLRDYLRTYPELSSDMEPQIVGYFMQLQCPQPSLKATAVLTQGMIAPTVPNVVSILLDIDLSRSHALPTEEEALWELLDQFRHAKNKIFEASITDRMRKLFQ
ncbi:MAG: TIGR04255 family protein [Candidatus Melainabacteria bacterium]|nr:TIGR04255 family protein [Candidatus Melainabacteria bacterium]